MPSVAKLSLHSLRYTNSRQNQKWLPHPYLLGGPKEGKNAMSPLHSQGSPNKGGQILKWLPHPCLLGGPKEGGNATSPLHSHGSPNKGGQNQKWLPHPLPSRGPKRGQKCYVTPTFSFSGVPKQGGGGGQNQKWLPPPCLLGGSQRGRKCYVTPAFLWVPNKEDKIRSQNLR